MNMLTVDKPIQAMSIAEARALPAQINPRAEVVRLRKILTPATEGEAMEALQFLFRILPLENAGQSEEEKDEITDVLIAGYALALRGYPRWAIMEARNAFIAGKVPGFSGGFAPRPPELGKEVVRLVDDYRGRLGRAEKQASELDGLEDERSGPLGDQARAYGQRRLEELRAASVADRQAYFGKKTEAYVDPNPITPEQMAALPDAPKRDGHLAKPPVPSFSKAS